MTNEARLRMLFEQHHGPVLAYFLRRTDRDSAYDGTEEVFLVVWRRLEEIPDGDAALRWMYGVARRVLANQRRATSRRARLRKRLFGLGQERPVDTEVQVIRRLEDEEVVEAMARLSPKDQEIIRLAYWEDLPHDAIGQILGCSTGAVDVRLHRAIRRLEKGLRPAGHTPVGGPAFLQGDGEQ